MTSYEYEQEQKMAIDAIEATEAIDAIVYYIE